MIDLLVEECRDKEVEIVDGPSYSELWSEFTMKDSDGHRIAFGGGISAVIEVFREKATINADRVGIGIKECTAMCAVEFYMPIRPKSE
ncbi:hypothetical protein [Paenibacillus cymbidii]|uniref:hypothetical protein n=1 Tax=Paenibacillus cymbidii TaxID=1639034 RepID=UPI001A9B1AFC|nr:hypothetical protein [Paenibacillus cymbidii]